MIFTISDSDRAVFAALSDALIPSAPGHLSASEAGVAGPLLDRIAEIVPERLDVIRAAILKAAEQSPDAALEAFRSDDPNAYDAFCETIAAAYFMSEDVRARINYPGRVAVPARTDINELEDLLLPVLEGGFAPREVGT